MEPGRSGAGRAGQRRPLLLGLLLALLLALATLRHTAGPWRAAISGPMAQPTPFAANGRRAFRPTPGSSILPAASALDPPARPAVLEEALRSVRRQWTPGSAGLKLRLALDRVVQHPAWLEGQRHGDWPPDGSTIGRLNAAIIKSAPVIVGPGLCQLVEALHRLLARDAALRRQWRRHGGPALDALRQRATAPPFSGNLTSAQLSRLVWAWGKLQVDGIEPLRHLVQQLVQRPPQSVSAQDVSMAMLGLARSPAPVARLMETLGLFAAQEGRVAHFGRQSLGNTAWCLAARRVYIPSLMEAMQERILAPDVLQTFKPVEISTIAWAYSRLGLHSSPVLAALADLLRQKDGLRPLKPQDIAMVAWAYAQPGAHDPELLRRIADHVTWEADLPRYAGRTLPTLASALVTANACPPLLLQRVGVYLTQPGHMAQLTGDEVSALARVFAQRRVEYPGLVEAMVDHVTAPHILLSLDSNHLANLVWAFAIFGHSNVAAMAQVAERLLQPGVLSTAIAHEVALLTWGYATLGINNTELVAQLDERLMAPDCAADLSPTTIANVAWAHAVLRLPNPRLLAFLAQRTVADAHTFRPSHISLTVWSFATLGYHDAALMSTFFARLMRRRVLEAASPQALSNVAWAYAYLNVSVPPLMYAIGDRLLEGQMLANCSAQSLANVVWAFANASIPHPAFLDRLAEEVLTRVAEFTAQGVSNVAWAYAKYRHLHPRLMQALASRVMEPRFLPTMGPQALANVAWAFAALDLPNELLFVDLGRQAYRVLPQFNPQELTTLAWALATMRVPHDRLLHAIALRLEEPQFLARCNALDISMACGAFATLGGWTEGLVTALLRRIQASDFPREWTVRQVMTVVAALRVFGIDEREIGIIIGMAGFPTFPDDDVL